MADRILIGNVRGPQGPTGATGPQGLPGKDAVVDAALSETSTNAVQNAAVAKKLNEVFRSVSEGKQLVASAITDKGIQTDATATFSTLAENISQIKSGEFDHYITAKTTNSIIKDIYKVERGEMQ